MEIQPSAEPNRSSKPFGAADAWHVSKKLAWHTGKAAWQFGTSFLILVPS